MIQFILQSLLTAVFMMPAVYYVALCERRVGRCKAARQEREMWENLDRIGRSSRE